MSRDLGDVLHYFIPEAPVEAAAESVAPPAGLVAVPLGAEEILRGALLSSLAAEVARAGTPTLLLACDGGPSDRRWPKRVGATRGLRIALCQPSDAADLMDTVRPRCEPGSLVFVALPPEWIAESEAVPELFAWTLVLATPDEKDLRSCRTQLETLRGPAETSRVGLTVHGVRSIEEARTTYDRVRESTRAGRRLPIRSYGVLLDDLDVYRAASDELPIGVARPQSRGARSLADVARLLRKDAGFPDVD